VARFDGDGGILGYFFGPRLSRLPRPGPNNELTAQQAMYINICSHLGLQQGSWLVLGRIEPWMREAWPVPAFGSIAVGGTIAWRHEYDDNLNTVSWGEVAVELAKQLPDDGSAGSGVVEIILSKRLPR
jgi:hypothetical protein